MNMRPILAAACFAAAGLASAEVAWQYTTNRPPETVCAATNALTTAFSSLGRAPIVQTGGTFDYGAFETHFRSAADTAVLAQVSSNPAGAMILVR